MNIVRAIFVVLYISLLIQSNIYCENCHVVILLFKYHSSICVGMNRRIFMNEAIDTNDGISTQPSTILWDTCKMIIRVFFSFLFSGMDIMHGCMPNKFSHILFGKLKDLSNNTNHQYRGDRIYIKPEKYGLQQFPDYLGRECITFVLSLLPMFCRI